jgi:hypothetical protein
MLRSSVVIVPYADDMITGFAYEAEAVQFLAVLRERMGQFALSLHPDKTRLIEFDRRAAADRERRGQGKPETFAYLGAAQSAIGRHVALRQSSKHNGCLNHVSCTLGPPNGSPSNIQGVSIGVQILNAD